MFISSIYECMVEEGLVNHEIHLKQRPVGMPAENDFQLVKVNVPDLKDGEFLVRNMWMSVDPYMRGHMRKVRSYISPFSGT
jgi:NADPH-dependent curcumin reductase CurA